MIYLGDKEVGVVEDSIDLSQTTATADDVLEGKEFFNASGEKVAGTYVDMLQEVVNQTKKCTYLFYYQNITDLSFLTNLDTSQVSVFESMCYGCGNLKQVGLFDTSNGINFNYMFHTTALTSVPLFNTSKGKTFKSMLSGTDLTEVPQFDLSSATDISHMYSSCSYLKEVPTMSIPNVTNAERLFYGAKILVNPLINTSKVKNWNSTFSSCNVLTTVENLDMISATSANSMFSNNYKLTTLMIKNIKISLQIGSGTYYGHLLTLDSLLNTIKELWTNTGTSTLTLTMGTANTAKLADVYVKLIPITDEMRAEDPYIDNKAPFVQCESTDEGAMLVTEYVTTVKNWQLA